MVERNVSFCTMWATYLIEIGAIYLVSRIVGNRELVHVVFDLQAFRDGDRRSIRRLIC
jgi:hypothetical protein